MMKVDVKKYQILERRIDSAGRVAIGKAFPENRNSDLAGKTVEIAVLDIYDPKEGEENNE